VHIHAHLVKQCQEGDRKAQHELYQLYSRAMFNICTRMMSNHAEAQDCLQEAFIDAFRHISRFDESATFGAWLKRITINKCISALRKRKRLNWVNLDQADASAVSVEFSEVDPGEADGKAARIQAAIKQLPTGCRAVFTLYALEGYQHKEIAEILEISESTSKSQYNRARKLLRASLENLKTA